MENPDNKGLNRFPASLEFGKTVTDLENSIQWTMESVATCLLLIPNGRPSLLPFLTLYF